MGHDGFVDYYEVLQVNPRAEPATISRVFHHLAKRYHPDNAQTGDRRKFDQLAEAHEILTNSEKRAAYDAVYDDAVSHRLSLLDEAIGLSSQDTDRLVRERLLSILYAQRRRDVREASVGEIPLEIMLDCPQEHLAFHLWYLKEKGWIERTDRGYAITALGIDEVEGARLRVRRDRLLTDGTGGRPGPENRDPEPRSG